MFEDFSEEARRVVFFARIEAGRSGSERIEPEHLLLGLLTEDQRDWIRIFGDSTVGAVYESAVPPEPFFAIESVKTMRTALAQTVGDAIPKPDTISLPVADEAEKALLAAQDRAGGAKVSLLHLLWGLMNDEESFVCGLLKSNGITVKLVEDAIRS